MLVLPGPSFLNLKNLGFSSILYIKIRSDKQQFIDTNVLSLTDLYTFFLSFPCKRVTSATRRGENPGALVLDSCLPGCCRIVIIGKNVMLNLFQSRSKFGEDPEINSGGQNTGSATVWKA